MEPPAIETNIDWEVVTAKMAEADVEVCEDEPEARERRVYLGTVFNWLPSGKYYLPFACSNVEPCPTCQGEGDLPNPARDDVQHAAAQLLSHWLCAELIGAYGLFFEGRWEPTLAMHLSWVRATATAALPEVQCDTCSGCGSQEAYHDDLWRERAESEAEAIGYDLVNGEGDPCDLFIVERFDPEEAENLLK
jgi:hypothetical protein